MSKQGKRSDAFSGREKVKSDYTISPFSVGEEGKEEE